MLYQLSYNPTAPRGCIINGSKGRCQAKRRLGDSARRGEIRRLFARLKFQPAVQMADDFLEKIGDGRGVPIGG